MRFENPAASAWRNIIKKYLRAQARSRWSKTDYMTDAIVNLALIDNDTRISVKAMALDGCEVPTVHLTVQDDDLVAQVLLDAGHDGVGVSACSDTAEGLALGLTVIDTCVEEVVST
jgi:hypothetical protein